MQRPKLSRDLALVAVVMLAIIVHGSLYPYAFAVPAGGGNPLSTLIGTWAQPPRSFGDLVANILLYMPFGLFAAPALNVRGRIWIITLAGLALCTNIEILQFYDQGRVSNASDIYLNTFGTWAGAIAGRALGRHPGRGRLAGRLSPAPCLLIGAFLGWRLYPYVPTIDLHKYWDSLKPVVLHPNFDAYAASHDFALWLAVSYLLASALRGPRQIVPFFAAFVFAAKVLIVDQSISPPQLAGAIFAIAVWLVVLQDRRWAPIVVGCILCATVVVQRLQPFHFLPGHREFGWLPFHAFLQGSVGVNIQSFFEKVFLYGSLVWLATASGARLWAATTGVAALLFLTSVAEIYLPGRSGEITDAIMVLIIGAIIAALRSEQRKRSASEAMMPRQSLA